MTRRSYAILDGTLIPTDRLGGTGDRRHHVGKQRLRGVNTQVIDALAEAGVMTFADNGYQGVGGTVRTPFKPHCSWQLVLVLAPPE
jgi:hypothetical protein